MGSASIKFAPCIPYGAGLLLSGPFLYANRGHTTHRTATTTSFLRATSCQGGS